MSQLIINIGTGVNDPTRDNTFVGFDKTNKNFSELYNLATSQGLSLQSLASGKQDVLTLGDVTELSSSVLIITGGSKATIGGAGLQFQVKQATSSQDGYLSATDWGLFNSKQASLGYTAENAANKGIANGYAPLDSSAKLPNSYLPASVFGALNYKGTWNALTNTPVLSDNAGGGVKGDYYVVNTPGSTPIDGHSSWATGDWIVNDGIVWDKVDNQTSNLVTSVAGKTGAVVLNSGDVGLGFVLNETQLAVANNLSDLSSASSARSNLGLGSAAVQNAGNLTEVTSDVLSLAGNVNAILGTGLTIQVKKASSSQDGYLSSTDWSTFNSKQPSLGYTPENVISKDVANGYAGLDASNLLKLTEFPIVPISKGGTNSAIPLSNNRFIISLSGVITEASAVTPNRVVVTNGAGLPVASTATDVEVSYLSGVSSNLQTQISNKQPLDSTLTGLSAGFGINGILVQTALDVFTTRLLAVGSSKLSLSNPAGVSGNPTFDVNESALTLGNLSGTLPYSKLSIANSIVNSDVNSGAAIAYSKLNLAGSIVNTDVSSSAAIAYSKLNLAASIVNNDIASGAAIGYGKLNLSSSIVNTDISAVANISYSKLNLASSIVNSDISNAAAIVYNKLSLSNSIQNSDIAAGAGIGYSKLNLSNSIINTDISSIAAIGRSKIAVNNANYVVINDGSGRLTDEQYLSVTRGGLGIGFVPGNGMIPIGNGSGYSLSAILEGPTQGVIVQNGVGIITLDTIQDLRTSAIPTFSQLTISNTPVNPTDTVNLVTLQSYTGSGFAWKDYVRVATTTFLPSYSATTTVLTASANGLFPAIDGITVNVGDSVLIKDEIGVLRANNGIYTLTQAGSGSTPWILTRRHDSNTAVLLVGASTIVNEGTSNTGRGYYQSTVSPIVLGSTQLVFIQTFGSSAFTPDNITIQLVSGILSVKDGGISNQQVSASAAIAYSKLALANSIVNSDISASAAISRSKIASGNANYVLINNGSGIISEEAQLAISRGGTGIPNTPAFQQMLSGDGLGGYKLVTLTASDGVLRTVDEFKLDIHGLTSIPYIVGTDEIAIYATADPYYVSPENRKVTFSVFESQLTLGNLYGVLPIAKGGTNSSTPLANNRFIISVGGEITEQSALTAHRVILSDSAGLPQASEISETELDSLSGIQGNIQVQLNAKISTASDGLTVSGTNVKLDIHSLTPVSYIVPSDEIVLYSTADPYYIVPENRKVNFSTFESHLTLGNLAGVLPIAKGGTNSSTPLQNNRFIISTNGEITEASALTAYNVILADADGLPYSSTISETQLDSLSGISGNVQVQLNTKVNAASDGVKLTGTSVSLDIHGLVPTSYIFANDEFAFYSETDPYLTTDNRKIRFSDLEAHLKLNNLIGPLSIIKGGTNSTTPLLNNRLMISVGGEITEASAIAANVVILSDSSGLPRSSAISETQLDALSGITGNIQVQLNSKVNSASDGVKLVGTQAQLDIDGLTATSYIFASDELAFFSKSDPYLPSDNRKIAFSTFESHLTLGNLAGILPVSKGGTNSSTPLSNNRFIISTGGEITEASAMTAGRVLLTDSNGLPEASSITEVQLDTLSGITGNIQTQLNSKVASASDGVKLVGTDARLDIHGLVPTSFLSSSVEFAIYSATDPYLSTDNFRINFATLESHLTLSNLIGPLSVAKGGTNSTTPLSNNRIMISTGGEITEAAAIAANVVLLSDSNGLPRSSAISETQLNSLSGISGNIQALLNVKLSTTLGNNKVWLGNASNIATESTISGILDVVGSTRGAILYRGSGGWAILAPSSAGSVLTDNGVGNDPTYSPVSASSSNFNHNISNASATLSGTTLTLTTQSGAISSSNPIRVAIPLANGTVQWINISSALAMTLPSATFTRSFSMMGFTNTDGQATLTLSGNAVDVIFFWYIVYDTATPYLAISRSPFHTQIPRNYWYNPTSSAITASNTDTDTVTTSTTSLAIGTGSKVFTIATSGLEKYFFADTVRRVRAYSASGATNFMEGVITSFSGTTLTLSVDLTGGSGTKTDWNIAPRSFAWNWDDMIISKTSAVTDTASPCICLGPLCYGTISGSTGRFSAMALTLGEFPKWNNKLNPVQYKTADGTAGNGMLRHELRFEVANGNGSTDTNLRKFTNIPINNGYAAQPLLAGGASASGSVGGTEVVANEDGDYFVEYADNFSGTSSNMGITVNDVQRTTAIQSTTLANVVTRNRNSNADNTESMNHAQFFRAGSIIRFKDNGNTAGTDVVYATVKKLGWGQASG